MKKLIVGVVVGLALAGGVAHTQCDLRGHSAKLEVLSNIGPGNVEVAGGGANVGQTIVFKGVYAGVDVQQLTGDGSSLTGCPNTSCGVLITPRFRADRSSDRASYADVYGRLRLAIPHRVEELA